MGMFSVFVKTKNNKLKMDAFRVGPIHMQSVFMVDPVKVKAVAAFQVSQVMNINKLHIPVWCQRAIFFY